MRYRVADYLCDSHWTICETQALLGKIHADWIPVSWEPSVFDELLFDPVQYIFSQDGKGTGVNSNNSMAGDAERDGDLPQLNVKSY
jgi:hypothetical protein